MPGRNENGTASVPGNRLWPVAPVVAAVSAVALVGVVYGLAFPQRTDYLGHFLAGAGATLLLLALVATALPDRPWVVLVTTWFSVLLGVGTEATVFRLAEFDPVDLANQSLGAVLAGLGLLCTRAADRPLTVGVALISGLLFVTGGFHYAFA